ncbi:type I secretion system permease/ATPase [Roseovarius spongiae]|uniref:Type I secretion system permease/ATPase n=1 Tax=Roseovarius spongiae TaxID=2320272 RepID=A0A3A8AR18_9RHOB|nr:type I secretion system permease/ATPase [Roseovarius spongiae]RKF12436.1 type I secretion system permease/ATPase [Roseovarius spongiae]
MWHRKTADNAYLGAFRELRGAFILVGLFSAAINVLMLTGPIYMLQVYDRVLSSGSVATLLGLFGIVILLYAFLGLYSFLRARLLSRAALRLDARIGDEAFRFVLRGGATGGRSRIDPRAQPVRDLELVRGFLGSPAIAGLFDMPWMPVFLGLTFLIHPWLGWLTLAGAGMVIVAALLNQVLAQKSIHQAMSIEGAERTLVEQAREDAETLQALGMRERLVRRWRRMHDAALATGQVGSDRSEGFAAFSKSFRLLLQSALLTMGAYLALRQEITPGMIIATSIIAGRALAPVDQVIGQWRAIGRAREAHQRLREVFDQAPPEKPRIDLPAPAGDLRVTSLTKLAPAGPEEAQADRPRILDRVSFALSPGDGLGVVGNSAAGKSTLAKLLVGVWTAESGEVRLDRATLDQWTPEALGRHIGYLPQSLQILSGSIAENIARFDPEAKDADIIEAARIAGVHDMILGLPDGYATHMDRLTRPLSGGQIQRLGLARAIYGAPRLIVLDEPNSNLDANGDDALAEAIRTMRAKGCVVVVMAHRPSALASVNKIMLLHQGRMAKFGDKDEVLHGKPRPVSVVAQ